jgi:hypothetical protein
MVDALGWVQWPAMAMTIVAAWLVASRKEMRRGWGFWIYLLSNVLWVVWGIAASAWALVLLQVFLAVTNIRGVSRNDAAAGDGHG